METSYIISILSTINILVNGALWESAWKEVDVGVASLLGGLRLPPTPTSLSFITANSREPVNDPWRTASRSVAPHLKRRGYESEAC